MISLNVIKVILRRYVEGAVIGSFAHILCSGFKIKLVLKNRYLLVI